MARKGGSELDRDPLLDSSARLDGRAGIQLYSYSYLVHSSQQSRFML